MSIDQSLWRHLMETFSALLALCEGNSPVTGEFPTQRPVTLSFDVFFDLSMNKWLSKQSRRWWFDTTSRPLWRHRNGEHWAAKPTQLSWWGRDRWATDQYITDIENEISSSQWPHMMRIKSPATQLFVQQLTQIFNIENTKGPHKWVSYHNGVVMRRAFLCYDVIIYC